MLLSGTHSWERHGANINYYAVSHKKDNKLGLILIDSILRAYKDSVIEVFSDRDQAEFYGVKRWNVRSSAAIGRAANKAILLCGYILAPIHRNMAKEGAAGINNRLIAGDNR